MKICALIPAAGRGSRLGLDVPKILVPVCGDLTIWTILRDIVSARVDHIHVVVSPAAEALFARVIGGEKGLCSVTASVQAEPTGMGDAIFGAQEVWSHYDVVLVVWGDQVNLSARTIERVTAVCRQEKTLILPLTLMPDPYVQYDLEHSRLLRIRQAREGDQTDAVGFSDIGLFALSVKGLRECWLEYLPRSSAGACTGESNFLPFLTFLSSQCGWNVQTIEIEDAVEARGVNTIADLEFARARFDYS